MRTIKRILCILLVTVMSVNLISPAVSLVSASEELYEFTLNGDGASYTLTSVSESVSFVAEIPEYYAGFPVTSISENAFSKADKVYKAVIPATVNTIEPGAFFDCANLNEIESRSQSFTVYSNALFTSDKKTLLYLIDRQCTEFTLSDETEAVSDYAFAQSSIVTVNIPESVVSVGKYCFAYCSSLVYATLPDSVTEISDNIFFHCTSLKGFSCAPTVLKIGNGAFNSCTSLESVLIPDGANVSDDAFIGCGKLTVYCKNGSSAYSTALACGVKTSDVLYDGSSRVEGIEISLSTAELQSGQSVKVGFLGTENAQVKDVITYISDEKVLSYSNGEITAISAGSAVFTAVSVDGLFSDSVAVTVTDPPSPLASAHPYANGMNETLSYTVPGEPEKIKVTFSDDTYTEKGEDYIYITDKNGDPYGVYSGSQLAGKTLILNGDTVNVRLTSDSDVTAYGYRIVSAVSADGTVFAQKAEFEQKSVELTVSDSYQTSVCVTPAEAFTGDIIYFSSDSSVASVDKNGVVCAVGVGVATVSAVCEYGSVIAQCTVTVADNAIDGIVYSFDSVGAVVEGCKLTDEIVTVPSEVNGYTVYKLAKGAFSHNTTLKVLNLPSTVTSIVKGAFGGNSSLELINIPDSNSAYLSNGICVMSKDGINLVTVCGGLSSFTVPDTVTTVNQEAFAYMYKLTSVTLGANTSSIIFGAFETCHALVNISVPSANTRFSSKDGVLYSKDGKTLELYPSGLGEYFSVPDGVTSVAAGAFHSCKALKTVNIPSSVTSIAPEIFCGARSVGNVTVSEENEYFSSYNGALYNKDMTKLLSVPPNTSGEYTVPDGVKTVARYAFYGCDISRVNLPISLLTVELHAFLNNRSLALVILPPMLQKVEKQAFGGCENIQAVAFDGITYLGTEAFGDGKLFCHASSVTYSTAIEAGIETQNARYIYDEKTQTTAVSISEISSNVGMNVEIGHADKNGTDYDKYTVTFTRDGIPYIPSSEFYITLKTPTDVGKEITVYGDDGQTVGYSASKYVSFSSKGGEYFVTPSHTESSITELGIKQLPVKTEYYKDSTVDTSGLVLYYLNKNGKVELITEGFEIEYGFSSYGKTSVKVKYASHTVEYEVNVIPKSLTGKAQISGGVTVGSVLTLTLSDIDPNDIPYTVTWYVNGIAVGGGNTYTVTESDMGKTVKVKVTANEGYTGSFESNEVIAAEDAITSDVYQFDKTSGISSVIPYETKVSEFISNLDQKDYVKITKGGKELSSDSYISTGTVISLVYGDVTTVSYTAVVTGDINGDGKISITDFAILKKTVLGTEQTDEFKKKASDVNGDTKVSITDFALFKRHVLGLESLKPKEVR